MLNAERFLNPRRCSNLARPRLDTPKWDKHVTPSRRGWPTQFSNVSYLPNMPGAAFHLACASLVDIGKSPRIQLKNSKQQNLRVWAYCSPWGSETLNYLPKNRMADAIKTRSYQKGGGERNKYPFWRKPRQFSSCPNRATLGESTPHQRLLSLRALPPQSHTPPVGRCAHEAN